VILIPPNACLFVSCTGLTYARVPHDAAGKAVGLIDVHKDTASNCAP